MLIDEEKLMELRPRCPCCRKRETRIILPNSSFNHTNQYLLHCKLTGRIHVIDDIEGLLRKEGVLS